MDYEKTMQLIRRSTYRMKVKQAGGKFIEVLDGKDLELEELAFRKAEFDKIMYDRDNGYSGYDEYNDQDQGYIDEDVDNEVADIA
jgi:hypothetical protein